VYHITLTSFGRRSEPETARHRRKIEHKVFHYRDEQYEMENYCSVPDTRLSDFNRKKNLVKFSPIFFFAAVARDKYIKNTPII
jgi:hypothetical protein